MGVTAKLGPEKPLSAAAAKLRLLKRLHCTLKYEKKAWLAGAHLVAGVDEVGRGSLFGPVVAVIPFEDFDEALNIANGVQYGLSAAIYTRNVNNAFRAQRDLQTGIVYVNAPTIGAETHLPFGGIKNTGNGHRESGEAALDFYSEWKTVYIDYSDRLQRAQIDNA